MQVVNDLVDLRQVLHFDDELEFDKAFRTCQRFVGGFDGFDVCAGVGDGLRHKGEQAVGVFGLDAESGAVGMTAYTFPVRIKLLFGVGFEQGRTGIAVDNHAFVFDQKGADGIARDGVATFGKMDAAGFLVVDFDGAEFDFAAEVLPCQFGDVHGDVHGQGVSHADVVEDFLKRGLFVVEVGEVFFFEVV